MADDRSGDKSLSERRPGVDRIPFPELPPARRTRRPWLGPRLARLLIRSSSTTANMLLVVWVLFMIGLSVGGFISMNIAYSQDGVHGQFTPHTRECSHYRGPTTCSWYGRFVGDDGTVHDGAHLDENLPLDAKGTPVDVVWDGDTEFFENVYLDDPAPEREGYLLIIGLAIFSLVVGIFLWASVAEWKEGKLSRIDSTEQPKTSTSPRWLVAPVSGMTDVGRRTPSLPLNATDLPEWFRTQSDGFIVEWTVRLWTALGEYGSAHGLLDDIAFWDDTPVPRDQQWREKQWNDDPRVLVNRKGERIFAYSDELWARLAQATAPHISARSRDNAITLDAIGSIRAVLLTGEAWAGFRDTAAALAADCRAAAATAEAAEAHATPDGPAPDTP